MYTKILEKLQHSYPNCHLHCDMTMAGQNSYRIYVAVIDPEGAELGSSEHFGTGDTDDLKAEAYELLYKKMESLTTV
jgi:hypothetical protein